ncbi:pyridoxamine 5'-phosphate oxidase family protein [Puniceibacterium sp. IMCC21224]|uniref:pyridoxamine 5'-phosphate oxidase family protein n=1 Tax=Puniceibacterium sp. IMCC21224 TaxID=1618204 RepID=UPI00064DAFF6|nr:pyridoxamine 5'-phosphate oxidase family protein [Puniceibacterium sp. IMCC21224]KMK67050.1 Pyridoxamine 5'-phosphate oxidase [Puniceibacterium sp. IMCC21224]
MGKQFDSISDDHRSFIAAQPMFFTGSAAPEGRINVSPKGMDSLRVLGPNRIVWLNFTGSGNETAAHVVRDPRMTLMWCSFAKRPIILRCYGTARVLHRDHSDFADLVTLFRDPLGARQIYDVTVEMVQSSCGYAVPLMSLDAPRETLKKWADDKGPDGVRIYWAERNHSTIDGFPTGIESNLT